MIELHQMDRYPPFQIIEINYETLYLNLTLHVMSELHQRDRHPLIRILDMTCVTLYVNLPIQIPVKTRSKQALAAVRFLSRNWTRNIVLFTVVKGLLFLKKLELSEWVCLLACEKSINMHHRRLIQLNTAGPLLKLLYENYKSDPKLQECWIV